MEASAEHRDRTYGNWRRPRSAGIGQLGTLGTIVLMLGLIIVILTTAIFGLLGGLIVLIMHGSMLGTLLVRDRHGKTGLQHITLRGGWIRARLGRANLYRSGPTGLTPWGTYQLPGLLAPSTLSEAHDSYDRPFALLRMPAANHYTVVLACEPDGAALVDQQQIDVWVARWGQWLASLGDEPGVVAASVTIETAPDIGTRLRNHVGSRIDPHAPPVSKAILSEVMDTYAAGSATIKAWVALTFTGIARGHLKDQQQMAHELASRLPQITQGLYGTGAGAVRPVSSQQLCEIVRVAYDPAAGTLLDEAQASGQRVDLTWSDVGPSAAETEWDHYRHEGARSITWAMTAAPRGESPSSILYRLLAPHRDIARKRITLLYRILNPGEVARIVESDLRNATFRATSSPRPTARSLYEQRSAQATAQEEARGASLVNFGMLVTATVMTGQDLRDAEAAVDNLAATARLSLRRVHGSQDSAFAAALPLGVVLPAHLKVPEKLRTSL